MAIIQDNRSIRIQTPLDENELIFRDLDGFDRLSTLFTYHLTAVSEKPELPLDDLLGKSMTIGIERPDGDLRFYNGIVADACQTGYDPDLSTYTFTLRPCLWLLTHTADCRIFQDKTVPEIVLDVMKEVFSDIDDRLTATYEKWKFCVQYRETDFNFVSRLMEQEGIYYFFRHENGKHILVLCDSATAHEPVAGYDSVLFAGAEDGMTSEIDCITSWKFVKRVQPGKTAINDFSYADPKGKLLGEASNPMNHANADYEIYDYAGDYPYDKDGKKKLKYGTDQARYRLESYQAEHEIAHADGNVHGVGSGDLFTLEGFSRSDQNREYLVVGSKVHVSLGSYSSGDGHSGTEFENHLEVIPSTVQFRAPQSARKTLVQGPQTALVVGKSGEEIWTDKLGRVKLKFPWDRYSKSDENSSCWVRVSQVWASAQYGAMHIPRINDEVIVEFLNGDPDHPIVTGRVYNGKNGVPYDLPANATQSGIKSRSSKGGTARNFNEIRMEDKKGEEELYLHAEKDMNVVVENDKTLTVGFDKSDKGNYTVDVKQDRTVTVDSGNDKLTVKSGNRTTNIASGNYKLNVKKNRQVNVADGDDMTKVKKGDQITEVSLGNQLTKVAVGSSKIEAMQAIELKVGQNSITIDQTGITLKGLNITVDAQIAAEIKSGVKTDISSSLMTNVKSDVMLTVDGQAMSTFKSGGIATIKGSLTMIN